MEFGLLPESGEWVRERGFLSLPVVAIGSIPYIIPACGFPAPGDPSRIWDDPTED
jgi:hypothetical protein